MASQSRVVIIGGTGGCAWHRPRHKAGVPVVVYERSGFRTERLQGYRVHINPTGARALHECLPPDQWRTFVETCGRPVGAFGFVNEQLKELLLIEDDAASRVERDPARSHHSVSRITLRQVLSAGLSDVLHLDEVPAQPGHHYDNATSYLMWAYAGNRDKFPHDDIALSTLDGTGLRALAGRQIAEWHPDLRRMVADTPADTVTLLPVRTSIPVRQWNTPTITVLGDAIHSMTPFRGIGANTALRDAQLLARNLIDAAQGRRELLAAIRDYETRMIDYGFAAVRLSLRTAEQTISNNRLGRSMFQDRAAAVRPCAPVETQGVRRPGQ